MKTKYLSGLVALYVLTALALPAGAAGSCESNTFSGILTLRDFKDRSAVLGSGSYEESLVTATVTVKLIAGSEGGFTTHVVQAATGSGSYWFYFPSTCNRPPEGRQGIITAGTIAVNAANLVPREAILDFDIKGTQVSTRCFQGLPESFPSAYTGNVKSGKFTGTLVFTERVVTSINFNRSTTDPDGRTHVTTGILFAKPVIADPNGDSDGDGLLDSWETECGGIDINGDGIIDLNLYALGARPDHKDLFIEIDGAPSPLSSEALDRVKFAFEHAPVQNPDKITGILLHFDKEEIGIIVPQGSPIPRDSRFSSKRPRPIILAPWPSAIRTRSSTRTAATFLPPKPWLTVTAWCRNSLISEIFQTMPITASARSAATILSSISALKFTAIIFGTLMTKRPLSCMNWGTACDCGMAVGWMR